MTYCPFNNSFQTMILGFSIMLFCLFQFITTNWMPRKPRAPAFVPHSVVLQWPVTSGCEQHSCPESRCPRSQSSSRSRLRHPPHLPAPGELHVNRDLPQYIHKIVVQVPPVVNVSFVILSHNASTEPSKPKRTKNELSKSYDKTFHIEVSLN